MSHFLARCLRPGIVDRFQIRISSIDTDSLAIAPMLQSPCHDAEGGGRAYLGRNVTIRLYTFMCCAHIYYQYNPKVVIGNLISDTTFHYFEKLPGS